MTRIKKQFYKYRLNFYIIFMWLLMSLFCIRIHAADYKNLSWGATPETAGNALKKTIKAPRDPFYFNSVFLFEEEWGAPRGFDRSHFPICFAENKKGEQLGFFKNKLWTYISEIEPSSYEQVKSTLLKKYGECKDNIYRNVEEDVKFETQANFNTWENPRSRIRLMKIHLDMRSLGLSSDDCYLMYSSKEQEEEIKQCIANTVAKEEGERNRKTQSDTSKVE